MMGRFRALWLVVTSALIAGACSNPVSGDGHRVMSDVVITAEDGTTILAQTENNQTWQGASLNLRQGEPLSVRIFFVAPDGSLFQLPATGATHTLHVAMEDASIAHYEAMTATTGRFIAGGEGGTTATVHLWHGVSPAGHPDASTPPLPIAVE